MEVITPGAVVRDHPTVLYKTHVYSDDNLQFTTYGFAIRQFTPELAFVERFSRRSHKSRTWAQETIYNSQTMNCKPKESLIPFEVENDLKRFLRGLIIESLSEST